MYWVYRKATKAMARVHFIEILDKMAISKNPKVATLRSTLIEWQRPILAYFDFKITNARVEGFNVGAEPISAKESSAGVTDIEK